MPVGILGSLAVCTVLYILVAGTLTGLVSYKALNVEDPIAVGVGAIGLGWLTETVKVGVIAGLSSVMLVLLFGQTRIFYTMASDGLLPSIFSRLSPRFHTPTVATWLLGITVSLIAAFVPLALLGKLVSIGTLFAFALVCGGVLYLRRTHPELPRPFRCPGLPAVPILGILSCLYLISGLPLSTQIRLVIWLVLGFVVYFGYSRHHSKLHKADVEQVK